MTTEHTLANKARQYPAPPPIHQVRQLRSKLRRLWKLPCRSPVSPALFAVTLLTMVSLGVTAASWVLVRLLPNQELLTTLAGDFPKGFFSFLTRLPALLADTAPSTAAVTGALVSQQAYIITYACGTATAFCCLLLVVALIRKW